MAKTLLMKLSQIRLCVLISSALSVFTIIMFFTFFGTYNYTHVPEDVIVTKLHKEVAADLHTKKSKPMCDFNQVLRNEQSILNVDIPKNFDDFSPNGITNGSFIPEDCNPVFSVALLVTYRNRQNQLNTFLPYMHNFLRKQNIHYKIYLIEQLDEGPWNKGLLYNIGAKQAISDKFPCLILHDVDLLPLDSANLYACLDQPRHMSASIDKFRFVLPYHFLVGGVLAIRAEQFVQVNGFSNKFEGWGGEDDDFYSRITAHNLNLLRFPPQMSRYTMLRHRQEPKNVDRMEVIERNRLEYKEKGIEDGLNKLHYKSTRLNNNRLFARVSVTF